MTPLNAPVAIAAVAYRDIETAHDGTPDNLFLILCFAAFRLHPAAAMRAVFRQWNGDPFIYARRDRTACPPAVAAPRFSARPLRIGFGVASRMRRGLALTGAQSGFQFSAQPLRLLFQALDLFLLPFTLLPQPLVLLLRPIQLPLGNKLDAIGLLVCGSPGDWFHPTLR